ncbi:regulator of chromosome condensation [Anaeramoeba flamelloides]|uniref:Regulator of chromosome condensation n=1 Tax=Anaeramoeba flamelloides TaxID=1746091 RepID=A0ABQ8Z6L4_9EUKA|nr:regulator of chromosome condensation [Anaeramoeba flamelloides]
MFKVFGCGYNLSNSMGISGAFREFTELKHLSSKKIIQIAPGHEKTWYLTEDRVVLEFGTHVQKSSTPKIHTIKDEVIHSIHAGTYHCMFLTESGKVYSIRKNNDGQCGVGNRSEVQQLTLIDFFVKNDLIVKEVICGFYCTFFVCENNELYGCGKYTDLGFPQNQAPIIPKLMAKNILRVFSSVEAQGFFVLTTDEQLLGGGTCHTLLGDNMNKLKGGSVLKKVISQPQQQIYEANVAWKFSLIITVDGKLYSSGSDLHIGREIKNNNSKKFCIVPSLKNEIITQMSTGQDQAIVLTNENKIYIWGKDGSYGQLGQGNTQNLNRPKEIIIPKLKDSAFIHLACGNCNTMVYGSPYSGSKSNRDNDFIEFFENGKFMDEKIHSYGVNKILIEIRTDKLFDEVKNILEEKFTDEQTKQFLIWVYGGYPNQNTTFTQIISALGIEEPYKRRLRGDLLTLYTNEDSKDFNILTKLDNDEYNEDDDEDEDEEELEEIPIHKFLLLARSGLFRSMFQTIQEKGENENSTESVQDFSGKTVESLEILFRFFYTGKIELTADDDPILVCEELNDAVEYYQLNKYSTFQNQLRKISKKL